MIFDKRNTEIELINKLQSDFDAINTKLENIYACLINNKKESIKFETEFCLDMDFDIEGKDIISMNYNYDSGEIEIDWLYNNTIYSYKCKCYMKNYSNLLKRFQNKCKDK